MRLVSKDHTRPWFCPKLVIFLLSSWFPHRLESKDHTRPWFCPKLVIFLLSSWFSHRLESEDHARPPAKAWGVELMVEAPRTVLVASASKHSP